MASAMQHIYTLNRGSKTLGLTHRNQNYIIGFQSPSLARKIHYNMHPEPRLSIINGDEINITNKIYDNLPIDLPCNFYLDSKATLVIPKLKGDFLHPLNDGCFHLNNVKMEDFYMFPYKYNLGIILPRNLEYEDTGIFLFQCTVLRNDFNYSSTDDD